MARISRTIKKNKYARFIIWSQHALSNFFGDKKSFVVLRKNTVPVRFRDLKRSDHKLFKKLLNDFMNGVGRGNLEMPNYGHKVRFTVQQANTAPVKC